MNKDLKLEIEEIIKTLMVSHDEDEEIEENAEDYFKFIDSIRFIELITAVESKYDIEFDSKDLVSDTTKDLEVFTLMTEKYINEKK